MEKLYNVCLKMTLDKREEFSLRLAEEAGVVFPDKPDEEYSPLTWGEIEEMEKYRIYFGSHTLNHEILTETNPSVAAREIRESKKIIESILGHEIAGFCYPNGNYDDAISKEVNQSGYKYAVTTDYGFNTCRIPLNNLRRIPELSGSSLPGLVKGFFLRPINALFISYMKETLWTR